MEKFAPSTAGEPRGEKAARANSKHQHVARRPVRPSLMASVTGSAVILAFGPSRSRRRRLSARWFDFCPEAFPSVALVLRLAGAPSGAELAHHGRQKQLLAAPPTPPRAVAAVQPPNLVVSSREMVEVSRGTRRSCSRRRRRLLLRYEYTAETEVSSRFPFDRRVASPLPSRSSSSHPSPRDLLPFDPPASPLVPRRVDSGLALFLQLHAAD